MPLVMFSLAKSLDKLPKTLRGRLEAKGEEKERERGEKEEETKGKVASLAACREVLQGRSSEFFDFSL